MRVAIAVLLVVGVACCATASLDGSTLTLLEPTGPIPPIPPLAVAMTFEVSKDLVSAERIMHVWITLPSVLSADSGSMWHDELVPGRPDFHHASHGSTLYYMDDIDGPGGVWQGETALIGAVATALTPNDWPDTLWVRWWLVGSLGNDLTGTLCIPTTPVESRTWGRIKALYH